MTWKKCSRDMFFCKIFFGTLDWPLLVKIVLYKQKKKLVDRSCCNSSFIILIVAQFDRLSKFFQRIMTIISKCHFTPSFVGSNAMALIETCNSCCAVNLFLANFRKWFLRGNKKMMKICVLFCFFSRKVQILKIPPFQVKNLSFTRKHLFCISSGISDV